MSGVARADYEALAALLMASAPGMPYANAEAIALGVVMEDAIPQRWATVKEAGLRLRVYPGTERNGEAVAVVTQLDAGTRCRIWRIRDDGWTAITLTLNRKTMGGWVASEFLEVI